MTRKAINLGEREIEEGNQPGRETGDQPGRGSSCCERLVFDLARRAAFEAEALLGDGIGGVQSEPACPHAGRQLTGLGTVRLGTATTLPIDGRNGARGRLGPVGIIAD